jgi:hypothetical protein
MKRSIKVLVLLVISAVVILQEDTQYPRVYYPHLPLFFLYRDRVSHAEKPDKREAATNETTPCGRARGSIGHRG